MSDDAFYSEGLRHCFRFTQDDAQRYVNKQRFEVIRWPRFQGKIVIITKGNLNIHESVCIKLNKMKTWEHYNYPFAMHVSTVSDVTHDIDEYGAPTISIFGLCIAILALTLYEEKEVNVLQIAFLLCLFLKQSHKKLMCR